MFCDDVLVAVPVVFAKFPSVRTRTAKKCTKMQNARAERAELLFLLIKPIVLWRYRTCSRRSCVSSLMSSLILQSSLQAKFRTCDHTQN